MKNIQIPYELFILLLRYHFADDYSCEKKIQTELENKLDALVKHELYSKYKTAPTEEERNAARLKYLDKQGVPSSFRW